METGWPELKKMMDEMGAKELSNNLTVLVKVGEKKEEGEMKKRSWVYVMVAMVLLLVPIVAFGQGVSTPSKVKTDSHVVGKGDILARVDAINYYLVECYDQYGILKWREKVKNLVTTGGLNMLMNVGFKGSTASSTWYVALVGTSTNFAAGDTQSSHAGWVELLSDSGGAYSNHLNNGVKARKGLTLGAVSAGAVDNSASVAAFTMNATTTVYGAALLDADSSTVGLWGLYGEGAFSTSRSVLSGDTINVTITLSVTASSVDRILYEYLNQMAYLRNRLEYYRVPTASGRS